MTKLTGTRPCTTKGVRFWLILLSLCLTLFVSALELTAVSTALPTIVADLHGTDFIWIGNAYALASSAILPMTGGLAQIFGRRPSFLAAIALFAIGSAVCGAADSMTTLIAGRAVQGLGGGGILSLTTIVIGDMVSLQERGLYAGGFYGLTWGVAAAIGPLVGGSLAGLGQWRWLFYLNLPICGISAALALPLLKLPIPSGTIREKISRMDWTGNLIVIASTCSVTVALTLGGVKESWASTRVLLALTIGFLGFIIFVVYEALYAKNPLVPLYILANRTSLSGYIQTFLLPVTTLAVIYYLPVYFQACKDADAVRSGVLGLSFASIAPSAVSGGISVKLAKRYRPQIWLGWCLQLVGISLFTLIKEDTPLHATIVFSVIYVVGAGFNYAIQVFPIQAPLPVTSTAPALAFLAFMRSFAGIWGITLGGAILQNELTRHLPPAFTAHFPEGVSIAYSAIPQIRNLPEPLKHEVRAAFADSLRTIWKVLAGVCGAGLLSTVFMQGLPLHGVTDEAWALANGTPQLTEKESKPQEEEKLPSL